MSEMCLTTAELLTATGTATAPGGLTVMSTKRLSSIKATYAVMKAVRACEGPLKDVEATRVKLIEQCAEKDDAGVPVTDNNQYRITDPALFQAGWIALLAEPVTLSGVRAVTLEEIDGSDLTAHDLLTAGPFITET